jgi:protein-tyrosine phosphatase
MIRVCFVCLGNICRSPTAEGVMRRLVAEAGYEDEIEIESAGTAAYHAGELPDPRSREESLRRGIRLESRARQFQADDYARFDYVLAMDSENMDNLQSLCDGTQDRKRLHWLRSFDPASKRTLDVPDPYYGGPSGFADVFDICEAGCRGLLAHIVDEHDLRTRKEK